MSGARTIHGNEAAGHRVSARREAAGEGCRYVGCGVMGVAPPPHPPRPQLPHACGGRVERLHDTDWRRRSEARHSTNLRRVPSTARPGFARQRTQTLGQPSSPRTRPAPRLRHQLVVLRLAVPQEHDVPCLGRRDCGCGDKSRDSSLGARRRQPKQQPVQAQQGHGRRRALGTRHVQRTAA